MSTLDFEIFFIIQKWALWCPVLRQWEVSHGGGVSFGAVVTWQSAQPTVLSHIPHHTWDDSLSLFPSFAFYL